MNEKKNPTLWVKESSLCKQSDNSSPFGKSGIASIFSAVPYLIWIKAEILFFKLQLYRQALVNKDLKYDYRFMTLLLKFFTCIKPPRSKNQLYMLRIKTKPVYSLTGIYIQIQTEITRWVSACLSPEGPRSKPQHGKKKGRENIKKIPCITIDHLYNSYNSV